MSCPIEQKTPLEQVEAFLECPQGNLSEKDLLVLILAELDAIRKSLDSYG